MMLSVNQHKSGEAMSDIFYILLHVDTSVAYPLLICCYMQIPSSDMLLHADTSMADPKRYILHVDTSMADPLLIYLYM